MNNNTLSVTCGLFANPSFIGGMARDIDLGATLQSYNVSQTEAEADFFAIQSDWIATGLDIQGAINIYANER